MTARMEIFGQKRNVFMKNRIKHLLIIILAISFAFSLGCGDSKVKEPPQVKKVTVSISSAEYNWDRSSYDNDEIANFDFPLTIEEARDLSKSFEPFVVFSAPIIKCVMKTFPGISSLNYSYTLTRPSFVFDETNYDDYDWKYGTPNSSYVLGFTFIGNFKFTIDDTVVKSHDVEMSLDSLVALYGRYDTVYFNSDPCYVFTVTDDVYLAVDNLFGSISLIYPHEKYFLKDQHNIHSQGKIVSETVQVSDIN